MKYEWLIPLGLVAAGGICVLVWQEVRKHGPAAQCLASIQKKTDPPKVLIAKCEGGLAQIDEIYRKTWENTDADGVNLYRSTRVIFQAAMARSYAALEGDVSVQVCTLREATWRDVAALDDKASPGKFGESFAVLRKNLSPAVARCRQAHGAPPDAPPLPS